MTRNEAPAYMVSLGVKGEDVTEHIQWLAEYIIEGFNDQKSRYDQAADASQELAPGANSIELQLLSRSELRELRQVEGRPRILTRPGLLFAELISGPDSKGDWSSTYFAKPGALAVAATTDPIFPIASIFASANAAA